METLSPSASTPRDPSTEESQSGDRISTLATSLSTTGSPWSDLITSRNLPPDALAFFTDLSNYLPLGCLAFEDFTHSSSDHDATPSAWQDITTLPWILGDTALSSSLTKLVHAGWMRVQAGLSVPDARMHIFRLYVLPCDAGHRFLDRRDGKLWSALQGLISEIDVSPETWEGRYTSEGVRKFDLWATSEEKSLFYMFNKLPSPSPSPAVVKEKYSHEALEDLLDPASVLPGLKTVLYPYQRRSAGLMLQREAVAQLELDPRLELRYAPDGSTYYYGARDLLFLRQPRYYEACRGGILAETMGLGKTVILLSLILATKHHQPAMPPAYSAPTKRAKMGKLSEMAISSINRKGVPWRVEFDRIRHASGLDMASCIKRLEASPPLYEVPQEPQRWNRNTILPPPKRMTLAATTLIVVPRNLCKQWQSELAKHVEAGALKVLVMEELKRALPPPDDLRTYDVVLFSRNRFELEARDGSDEQGRRLTTNQMVCRCPYIGATRVRNCNCVRSDDLYDSPLKHLHFKRLVIDEGHFFGLRNDSKAVTVANKLIKADHRWVVSGTPAKDLLGVEVDMSMTGNITPQDRDAGDVGLDGPALDGKLARQAALDQRRAFSEKEDIAGAVKSLGVLATSFLKIRPWSAEDGERKEADWDDHIYRHEDLRRKTYSGFSTGLRRTLEAMVVKTQPEDVERDIELPPLSHEVVRLEPSFYDKVSANLFTLVLTANAVTSERTDADYLFHKNSAKARLQLVQNLRQSAFFWTGFSEADVLASIGNSQRYLAKEGTSCSDEDRQLLAGMIGFAERLLDVQGWKAMSRSYELGLFVDGWPEESAEHWTFDGSTAPLLTGVSQLLEAQKHVNERVGTDGAGEGLAGAGIRALAPARHAVVKEEPDEADEEGPKKKKRKIEKPVLTKSGIPTSSLEGEPALKRRSSISKAKASPKQAKLTGDFKVTKAQKRCSGLKRTKTSPAQLEHGASPSPSSVPGTPKGRAAASTSSYAKAARVSTPTSTSQPSKKRRRSELEAVDLPDDSAYIQSRIVGTASAKLSYLISEILKHYKEEKILVFYDGDNVAYYIAQALELLHIQHEIYAKSLPANLKSEYVVRFDQEAKDRVLLMDVKQAAFGLNLSSASRIYFVNPVCRPGIEAQAIKRAHRIGQTRKVCVETLVLKGTVEEAMLERAQRMTRAEHADAKTLEDDGGIKQIIQNARLLPLSDNESQIAPLEVPQQLWGREGWRDTVAGTPSARPSASRRRRTMSFEDITREDEDARLVNDDDAKPSATRRGLSFVDCTSNRDDQQVEAEDSGEESTLGQRQRSLSFRTPPPLPKGMREDSIMPSVTTGEHLAPVWSPLHTCKTPGVPMQLPSVGGPAAQRLSIAQLLNDEHDSAVPAALSEGTRNTELLRKIIQRLG